ncbi:HAD family hydrolase [Kurthia sibirica]|uniref:Haloacid dehalogenase n=1 Tax=Kurthia sibirica TaxID=202750 RepID=A0A2U3APH1_9BACL|nr:HAD family hydrolase [Kurthia sibirica]PWI26448.1 haloacid dehalogenase [Kurthia sibirica]GEK33015.1 haloacid dehalogenase [Kurthia sibirica]
MHTYIFDFDGTLADSKQCSILATQQAFASLDLPIPSVESIEYYMGIPIERSFIQMATKSLDEEEFTQLLITFRMYYKQFEMESLTVFPQIPFVLEQLAQQNIRCFVLSSKKTNVLERNLQMLGIDHFFVAAIGSDQVAHYKPHPEGIQLLLNKYHIHAENALMIGDAIFDIQMGQAANIKTCAVTWGSHSSETLAAENPSVMISKPIELLHIAH